MSQKEPSLLTPKNQRQGDAMHDRGLAHSAQFSSLRPDTLENSFILFVTNVNSSDRACPAIIISRGPMGLPFFSSSALILGLNKRDT